MNVYEYVPFLAIKGRRRDLLPRSPADVEGKIVDVARGHLRSILFGRREPEPTHPKIFFLEANLVAFSPSNRLWERFCKYYADLSLEAFRTGHPLLREHYPAPGAMDVPSFLSIPRPYPELRMYHLEVREGRVFLGDRAPYLSASLLYSDMLSWIERKVRPLVLSGALDDLREVALSAISPPRRGAKRNPFIDRLISATGIPDGRKRILFYWLIPYWVTVEGKGVQEVLDLATEWVSRQGGGKIYSSWIVSEAENVRSKGIRPWSLEKVERIDPELVRMLREMGIL